MTIGRVHGRTCAPTVASMDTRHLGYVGLAVLIGIIVLTLVGVSADVWIPLVLIGGGIGVAVVHALASGSDIAERVVANGQSREAVPAEPAPPEPAHSTATRSIDAKPVQTELVRAESSDGPAVWLHRCGGRRVHRYTADAGWVVEQVSTKDPDNPKKRVIGESLTFALESDAITAADDLARGQAPSAEPTMRLDHTSHPAGATA